MKYVSTRGKSESVGPATAIKNGIAPDGGLYMPVEFPLISEGTLAKLCDMDYPSRAAEILYMFLSDDYSMSELLSDCREAYAETSFPGGAAQTKSLNGKLKLLELWHGPTSAFKDMALQLMPRLLSRALDKTGEKRTAHILVATSGDTGKAALEGYKDKAKVKITVFYPAHGVSTVQKLQMATQEGSNVFVQAVDGNFDDTQNGVKAIFADEKIRKELDEKGYFLSSANSINWGRLVPQIVYYISAYCDLLNLGNIKFGEEINVCVPTGNFGNIFAAYIAKEMGLPINTLVCASNRNRILTDFFENGVYDRQREFYTTSSPSMDILISSNLERLLYTKFGPEYAAKCVGELSANGKYSIDSIKLASLLRTFHAYSADEAKTFEVIKNIYSEYGYLSDPHTAVGIHAAKMFMDKYDDKRCMLSVSTASPYKFAYSVFNALTGKNAESDISAVKELNELTGVKIPLPLDGIEKRKIRFDPESAIKAEMMRETVLKGV